MNYRDELLAKIEYHELHAKRLIDWVYGLDQDGFGWDNVTDAQKWAIEHNTTTEVQQ